MTHRMLEARSGCGWREKGKSRRRWILLLTAVVFALGGATSALATSGGSGLGGHKKKHKKHRTHHVSRHNPLADRGMWIWELGSTNGGDVSSIIAQAHRHQVQTLIIKSGDGSGYWSQFSRSLVRTLHHHGLHVCAWQFVYGNQPAAEASVGAEAKRHGADCLMIDAEGQYEGKYVAAQTYIRKLRRLVGARYPLALAGLPYVDYHPAFPYSVFLGPGGAQYNAPQMYWYVIGTSPDGVYAHTYEFNRMYRRKIYPIGEGVPDPPAGTPPAGQIRRFRQMARAYHAPNASWWVWQDFPATSWHAISQRLASLRGYRANKIYASIGPGAQGDLVIWAQEHLARAGESVGVDGSYGSKTTAAVRAFQSAHRLRASGTITAATWAALLRYRAMRVTWARRNATRVASAAGTTIVTVPRSAALPSKRYEIPPALGAGRPRG
ncbi:MAG: peptidoglycan-binding domain-containing protein [Solirubrobacteraceae bacterium]